MLFWCEINIIFFSVFTGCSIPAYFQLLMAVMYFATEFSSLHGCLPWMEKACGKPTNLSAGVSRWILWWGPWHGKRAHMQTCLEEPLGLAWESGRGNAPPTYALLTVLIDCYVMRNDRSMMTFLVVGSLVCISLRSMANLHFRCMMIFLVVGSLVCISLLSMANLHFRTAKALSVTLLVLLGAMLYLRSVWHGRYKCSHQILMHGQLESPRRYP